MTDFLRWIQRILQSIGSGMIVRFHEEPVLTGALLRACVVLGTTFVLSWSETQIVAAYGFIEALTAFVSRREVTPNVRVPVDDGDGGDGG